MATTVQSDENLTFKVPEDFKLRAVTICFLAAFVTGGFGAIMGLVSPQISHYYGVHVSHIVYLDVLNIIGLLIGNALSAKTMNKLGCRKTLLIALGLGIIAQYTIALALPLYIYAICALLNGTGIGFLVPAVSQTIHTAYNANGKSESRLNVLNFFFGIGSSLIPIVGGQIVQQSSWKEVFIGLGTLYITLFIVIIFLPFEKQQQIDLTNISKATSSDTKKIKLLNTSVLLIAIAIMLYVYMEYIVSYWFSPYLQEDKMISVVHTATIIGLFWGVIAFSRLIVGLFVLTRVKPVYYIMISSAIAGLGFIIFILANSLEMFIVGAVVLGIGCAAMFPTLLGFGINNANYESPKVASFIIMSGSIGATICLFISGFLGQHIDKKVPIFLGPILAICIIILVFIVLIKHRNEEVS